MGTHAKTQKQQYQTVNGENGTLDVVLAPRSACLGRYVNCTNKHVSLTVTNVERINPDSTHPEMCKFLFVILGKHPFKTESGKMSFLILYIIRIIKHKGTIVALLINYRKTHDAVLKRHMTITHVIAPCKGRSTWVPKVRI